jgi:GNAT superfamily N-acetyltransferase
MAKATNPRSGTPRKAPGSRRIEGPGKVKGPGKAPAPGKASVRPFRETDLDRLRALRRQVDVLHARLLPGFFRVPSDIREPGLERDATSEILVVDGPDGVCGYAQVRVVETPRHPAMTPARRTHVETLVVAAAQRRQGFGKRLMREAQRWAEGHGASELVLTVWSENAAAAGFYRALGFLPVAQVLSKAVDDR